MPEYRRMELETALLEPEQPLQVVMAEALRNLEECVDLLDGLESVRMKSETAPLYPSSADSTSFAAQPGLSELSFSTRTQSMDLVARLRRLQPRLGKL